MAQQTINVGAAPNDGTGTPLRTAFQYTNSNFTELYTAVGPSGNNIVVPGSATITGNLTVDTSTLKVDSANDWVGVGTATPAVRLHSNVADAAEAARFSSTSALLRFHPYVDATDKTRIQATNATNTGLSDLTLEGLNLRFNTNGGLAYAISNIGVSTWSVGGSTAMTLNSTGLGVGSSPQAKLHVSNGATIDSGLFTGLMIGSSVAGSARSASIIKDTSTPYNLIIRTQDFTGGTTGSFIVRNGSTDQFQIDSSGNVGIGVTPSAWNTIGPVLQIEQASLVSEASNQLYLSANAYFASGNWNYINNSQASQYYQSAGSHVWRSATASTGTISFSTLMTLDANGNLILQSSATPATLTTNGQLTVNATSNTNLRFSYRGSDGVTRVANITLA